MSGDRSPTEAVTLLGGIPNVYASLEDVQEIAFQGGPLITTVVTTGTPTEPTTDLAVLTSDQVEEDTIHAMRDAVASIENSRTMMWVVAAIIVAALMYVSSLERLRDFAQVTAGAGVDRDRAHATARLGVAKAS